MEAESSKPAIQPKRLPSAFSLIEPSFDALKLNISVLLGLLLYIFLFSLVAGLLVRATDVAIISILFIVVGLIVALLLGPIVPYVQLMSAKGQKVTMKQSIDAGLKRFWKFYGISIAVGFLVIGGLILFIVPGLIMIRRYFLATYYLYDRDLSIGEAMKQSAADSKEFAGSIWGIVGVTILFSFTGIVPIIGQIISAALQIVYACAPAIRYLQIKDAPKTPAS